MRLFTPDDYLSSVTVIDVRELYDRGYRTVLLDIDNTLVPRDTKRLGDDVLAWVGTLKQRGIRICLLSNNWHRTVFAYAEKLGVPIVYKAMKPAPFAFFRALGKAGRVKDEKSVMIGDQMFTDVLGARLAGIDVILVEPQAVKDIWYTLLFRKVERRLLKGKVPRV